MHSIGTKHPLWTHSCFFSGGTFTFLKQLYSVSFAPKLSTATKLGCGTIFHKRDQFSGTRECYSRAEIFFQGYLFHVRAFARRKPVKRLRKNEQESENNDDNTLKTVTSESPVEENTVVSDVEIRNVVVASRSDVLRACTVTSGFIAVLGLLIRQGSHIASVEGVPIVDSSTRVSFDIEFWHLGLIGGLVILVSSCRYLLLTTWPDFAESTEAANQQVLTPLEFSDYIIVSFLPGISEELLFRGGLLPLLGMDYKSVLIVAAIFGVLHLGGGRKYSFAIWATFVGFVYGYATVLSSSIIVPMASHAVNNLVGGILWRQTSKSLK